MRMNKLTLATICDGQVQDAVNRALETVANNIVDPNMDPKKAREVHIVIKMTPKEEDPEDVAVQVAVTKKLAAENPFKTQFYVTKDLRSGSVTIQEHKRGEIKGQMCLDDLEDFDPETGEIIDKKTVTNFRRKEG